MQLCRLTGYQDLQKLMLKEMNTILHDDILTTEQDVPLFRIKIVDGVSLEVENLANSRVIPAWLLKRTCNLILQGMCH